MRKALPYALATCIIAAGFVSSTATADVSAASSYKLVKNKLVHSKTSKIVKNHAIYKNKLYKNGKLVTKTTVYNKFLFKKGSLVTNATVHNKQLFHKGKLATGNDLHNKTLYVNGKISSDIIKYNKVFYKAGKKVSATFKFIYKGKVYKGNKVDTNFKFDENQLNYKGEPFIGLINGAYYEYGLDLSDHFLTDVFYSTTGKSISLLVDIPTDYALKYNVKNIRINNEAVIKNAKTETKFVGKTQIRINVEKTQMNKDYTITFDNVSYGSYKSFSFEQTFSGLTARTVESKNYQLLKKNYDKYKNYSKAKIKTVPKNTDSYSDLWTLAYSNLGGQAMRNSNIYSVHELARNSLARELYMIFDMSNDYNY